jgi:hypothetical protein
MKKLILLAVVIIGFTAMSFGQVKTASGVVTGQINVSVPASTIYVGSLNALDFGVLTLNPVGTENSWISVPAQGSATTHNITITGLPKAAKFEIKNTGTPVTIDQITLAGTEDLTSLSGKAYFETCNSANVSDATTKNTSGMGMVTSAMGGSTPTNYTQLVQNGSTPTNYYLYIGGFLTISPDAQGGTINLGNLSVTVNGH